MYATTIDEVITELDTIIAWCIANKNRGGYFASLYKKMTIAVQQGIAANAFEDGKRMEQLDVIFANRYFNAWYAYLGKQPCSNAWCTAFDACQNPDLIVLQHLLLGINTHINLDLCIAAADCCPGNSIYGLQSDFDKINQIIEAQSQLIQNSLTHIWPPLGLLTDISNRSEKSVLNFSIDNARKCSWANAIVLANIDAGSKDSHISDIDNMVVIIAKKIVDPGMWMSFLLKPVRMMEDSNVDNLITTLQN
jgi:hypothetical protein